MFYRKHALAYLKVEVVGYVVKPQTIGSTTISKMCGIKTA